MNRLILYLSVFILVTIDAHSNESMRVYDIKDTSIFYYRQNLMSSIFPDISWDKPGLYLFLEKSYLQLFYFDYTNKVEYYQYPQQKKSKWLEPEEYLKERNKIESKNWLNLCFSKIIVDSTSLETFFNLHIEEYPYIVNEYNKGLYDVEMEPSYKYGKDDVVLYLGFKVDEFGKNYFIFRRFNSGNKYLKPPVSNYLPAYQGIDEFPFVIKLEDCK